MHDLGLAVTHHVLVFGLLAVLAAELGVLSGDRPSLASLGRLDGAYGLLAALVLAVGVGRVVFGGKGWLFYQTNPFFWAKVGVFVLIGLISIAPTMTFIRWRREQRATPGFQPSEAARRGARRLIWLQLWLFAPLVACAAAMARWPF